MDGDGAANAPLAAIRRTKLLSLYQLLRREFPLLNVWTAKLRVYSMWLFVQDAGTDPNTLAKQSAL